MIDIDVDSDAVFDAPSDLEMLGFSVDDSDLLPPESPPNMEQEQEQDSGAQTQRRYLSKRPHRKSRAGCKQCKRRKVVCLSASTSQFASYGFFGEADNTSEV